MGKGQSKSVAAIGAGVSLAGFLMRPQNRGWVTTLAVVLAAIVGSCIAWQKWGAPSLGSAEYLVVPEQIEVTPQPTWIHTNVKADCIRSLAGIRLDLLDRDLVEKVANAFALHPWVAQVVRIEKRYPAQLSVDIEYRRPTLVVKLDSPGEDGLLFLDEEAVLLPSSDFAPGQARSFLRLSAAGETPSSVYGAPWNSERIAGAARLATIWGTRWQPLGLYWIFAAKVRSGEMIYELRSQDDKVRVIWGVTPGHESPHEPSAEQKIAALEQFVHDKGPLDKSASDGLIDLRALVTASQK
jgi:hypothetical protein